MSTIKTPSNASWPFPAAGHFKRASATQSQQSERDEEGEPEHDHAEKKLVDERLECDRNSPIAVDSTLRAGFENVVMDIARGAGPQNGFFRQPRADSQHPSAQ